MAYLSKYSGNQVDSILDKAKNLPSGLGSSGQLLVSNGTSANWQTVVALPKGGTTGQILSKIDGQDGNAEWIDIPTASDTQLGGIKVGSGLSISDGVLSVTDGDSSVLKFFDVTVPTTAWVDSGDSEFPYKANIALTGVTTNHVPDVIFDTRTLDERIAKNIVEISDTYNGGITLYSTIRVDADITISTVLCF